MSLGAVKKVAKDFTYFNKAVGKARNLGLVESLHPNTVKAPLKSAVLPGKIDSKNIGFILSDGTLKFKTEEQAMSFGKGKILDCLNQEHPIEIDVSLGKNGRVLGISKGNIENVIPLFEIHPELKKYAHIQMHGHPDFFINHKGYTTAPSPDDYRTLVKNNYEKMIIFNSEGEYYSLVKDPKFNKNSYEQLADSIDKDFKDTCVPYMMGDRIYGSYTRKDLINEDRLLDKAYANFVKKQKKLCADNATKEEWAKLENEIKDFYNKSNERINIMETSNYEDAYIKKISKKVLRLKTLIEDDRYLVRQSEEFWNLHGKKYGVLTETNFSHFEA